MVIKKKLTIQGMHCASCSMNVEKSLKKIKGVKNASASVMTKQCFIEIDENESVSNEELAKAVARAGYKLIKIEDD